MAVVLQIVGLLLVAGGMFIWFGPGPGLVTAGACAIVAGTAVELDRRR